LPVYQGTLCLRPTDSDVAGTALWNNLGGLDSHSLFRLVAVDSISQALEEEEEEEITSFQPHQAD